MTDRPARPVFEAVLRATMGATGATRGRLLTTEAGSEQLTVVAVRGVADGDRGWSPELVGYVVATGQPQVVSAGVSSALCAPCRHDDEVVGALELADKAGGSSFTIDDLEMAGLLGAIAGVAILAGPAAAPPSPTQLTGDLGRLAAADPARYGTVARLVQGLLHG